MSKKVIATMKKHMSLEERKRFVKNSEKESGKYWFKHVDNMSLRILFYLSFNFYYTRQGSEYWNEILGRFTPEELSLTINLKEL